MLAWWLTWPTTSTDPESESADSDNKFECQGFAEFWPVTATTPTTLLACRRLPVPGWLAIVNIPHRTLSDASLIDRLWRVSSVQTKLNQTCRTARSRLGRLTLG